MTMTTAFPKSERHAQLVWFDPGSTTGIVALAIRPRWLEGNGDPGWEALGRAITTRWFGQVGREARVVEDGRAKRPTGSVVARGSGKPWTVDSERRIVQSCEAMLDMWLDAAWGYESFQPTPGAKSGDELLSPVRISSALAYVEAVHGERRREPFVQSASQAKTTATDVRLQSALLYRPGMRHANDAARHAALFLREARQDPALRHEAWPRLFKAPEDAARSAPDAEDDFDL